MILADGLTNDPGTIYEYSSRSAHLVTAVLAEALRQTVGDHPRTVLDYAREKLFDPLEIDSRPAYENRGSPRRRRPSTPSGSAGRRMRWDAQRLLHAPTAGYRHGQDRRAVPRRRGLAGQEDPPGRLGRDIHHPSSLNPEYGLMWLRTTTINQTTAHNIPSPRLRGQLVAVVPTCASSSPSARFPPRNTRSSSDVSFLLTDVSSRPWTRGSCSDPHLIGGSS